MLAVDDARSVTEAFSDAELNRAIETHRVLPHEPESPSWNLHLSQLLGERIRRQARRMQKKHLAAQAALSPRA